MGALALGGRTAGRHGARSPPSGRRDQRFACREAEAEAAGAAPSEGEGGRAPRQPGPGPRGRGQARRGAPPRTCRPVAAARPGLRRWGAGPGQSRRPPAGRGLGFLAPRGPRRRALPPPRPASEEGKRAGGALGAFLGAPWGREPLLPGARLPDSTPPRGHLPAPGTARSPRELSHPGPRRGRQRYPGRLPGGAGTKDQLKAPPGAARSFARLRLSPGQGLTQRCPPVLPSLSSGLCPGLAAVPARTWPLLIPREDLK
ncbi:spidroin-2-like [Dasypus novemcinctus]|uniref:spidroin-2-like n=1 Tax=Dasypus novemcinctus TaxID=9361 RepID=UPI00265E5C19|nr:basic proline-rich protein-like [Dasypus novemcinctus]